MGCVYLLMEVDVAGNERYKIGFSTKHPDTRVKALQTGNPNVITLVAFYETYNYQKLERWLHGKFGAHKTEADNEWFALTNEQVGSFIDTCKEIDKTIKLLIEQNPFYK